MAFLSRIVFVLILLLPAGASASYFQTYCSNADGSLRLAMGHDRNEAAFILEDGLSRVRDVLDIYDLDIVYTREVRLEGRMQSGCQPGQKVGLSSWYDIRAQKVHLTKLDGSKFNAGTVGLSEDGKVVEAYVLCEERGYSEALCENQEVEPIQVHQTY